MKTIVPDKEFLKTVDIPAALLTAEGKVTDANSHLSNFLKRKIKKDENLILSLKKKLPKSKFFGSVR